MQALIWGLPPYEGNATRAKHYKVQKNLPCALIGTFAQSEQHERTDLQRCRTLHSYKQYLSGGCMNAIDYTNRAVEYETNRAGVHHILPWPLHASCRSSASRSWPLSELSIPTMHTAACERQPPSRIPRCQRRALELSRTTTLGTVHGASTSRAA